MQKTEEGKRRNFLSSLVRGLRNKKTRKIKRRKLPDDQYEALSALKCCVWYNEYGGYCLPEASLHRSAARRILKAEVFEPQTIEFMRKHCATGDVVHAGTYFGDFLPGIASALAPGATLWAFEPNPENFRCAGITIAINALENVRLHNAGLGERRDVLHMRTRDDDGTALGGKSRLIDAGEFNQATDEAVQILTIDDTVTEDRAVSIIQLDVEDHEKAALTGALGTIRRCRPILIVEVRRGSTLLESQWFADTILSLGYRETQKVHGNTVFQCVET